MTSVGKVAASGTLGLAGLGAAAGGGYVYNNLTYHSRDMAKVWRAGVSEKSVEIDGRTGTWDGGFDHAETRARITVPTTLIHTNWAYGDSGILMAAMDGDDADRARSLIPTSSSAGSTPGTTSTGRSPRTSWGSCCRRSSASGPGEAGAASQNCLRFSAANSAGVRSSRTRSCLLSNWLRVNIALPGTTSVSAS